MSPKNKIRVAALATALFVGGLTAAGIGLRSSAQQQPPVSASAPAAVKQARTRTVVETVDPAGGRSQSSIAGVASPATVVAPGSDDDQYEPTSEADDDSGGHDPADEHEFDD